VGSTMNTDLMFSSKNGNWRTPKDFHRGLNYTYEFDCDVGASKENALNQNYLGLDNGRDAFTTPWGLRNFCNPPYGRSVGGWLKRGFLESRKGKLVVMLVPARTDTKWFRHWIWKKANDVFLVQGRLKFDIGRHFHEKTGWCEELHPAPFPSMVVVYDPETGRRKPSFYGTEFHLMDTLGVEIE
jgi:phage N-6-adenine-methyltransferase